MDDGTITFKLFGPTSSTYIEVVREVESAEKTLSITASKNTVVVNVPVTLTFAVKNQYSSVWTEDVLLTISDGIDNYEATATDGKLEKATTYSSQGDYTVTVSASGAKTATQTINVSSNTIEVYTYGAYVKLI